MTTGLLARAALISSIYKRGIYMTGKARTNFPNSALVNHISTDVSRVDACAQWFVSLLYFHCAVRDLMDLFAGTL